MCIWYKFPGDYNISYNLICSTQPDSQVVVTGCPMTITFFKMAAYRIAIMNDDIGKFGYDSMQQRTKIDRIYEKYLTKNIWGKVFNL